MDDRSAHADGRATSMQIRLAYRLLHELADEVRSIRERVAVLERPRPVQVTELDLVDDEGTALLRLHRGEAGRSVGIECLGANNKLLGFFGAIDGVGSLVFTGGRYGNVVVDLGADADGPHLLVGDGEDRMGSRWIDALGPAILAHRGR